MSREQARLRMFAGPNGSGKTTVKNGLRRSLRWYGIYINPDDIERTVRDTAQLSLNPFGLTVTAEEVRRYFAASHFLQIQNLHLETDRIQCLENVLDFGKLKFNSYHASVLADFLRRKALAELKSFTFETVMSSQDKVDLLAEAQAKGFRTYLYFVATDDPAINVDRVRNRVASGGHDVPEDKIVSRHRRSLNLLLKAIGHTNRAFFFDTSTEIPWFFAEVTDGTFVDLKSSTMPTWFQPVWDKLV